MTMDSNGKDVVRVAIIGGGISGLSAAYDLSKHENVSVTLFEASARLGGQIQTTRAYISRADGGENSTKAPNGNGNEGFVGSASPGVGGAGVTPADCADAFIPIEHGAEGFVYLSDVAKRIAEETGVELLGQAILETGELEYDEHDLERTTELRTAQTALATSSVQPSKDSASDASSMSSVTPHMHVLGRGVAAQKLGFGVQEKHIGRGLQTVRGGLCELIFAIETHILRNPRCKILKGAIVSNIMQTKADDLETIRTPRYTQRQVVSQRYNPDLYEVDKNQGQEKGCYAGCTTYFEKLFGPKKGDDKQGAAERLGKEDNSKKKEELKQPIGTGPYSIIFKDVGEKRISHGFDHVVLTLPCKSMVPLLQKTDAVFKSRSSKKGRQNILNWLQNSRKNSNVTVNLVVRNKYHHGRNLSNHDSTANILAKKTRKEAGNTRQDRRGSEMIATGGATFGGGGGNLTNAVNDRAFSIMSNVQPPDVFNQRSIISSCPAEMDLVGDTYDDVGPQRERSDSGLDGSGLRRGTLSECLPHISGVTIQNQKHHLKDAIGFRACSLVTKKFDHLSVHIKTPAVRGPMGTTVGGDGGHTIFNTENLPVRRLRAGVRNRLSPRRDQSPRSASPPDTPGRVGRKRMESLGQLQQAVFGPGNTSPRQGDASSRFSVGEGCATPIISQVSHGRSPSISSMSIPVVPSDKVDRYQVFRFYFRPENQPEPDSVYVSESMNLLKDIVRASKDMQETLKDGASSRNDNLSVSCRSDNTKLNGALSPAGDQNESVGGKKSGGATVSGDSGGHLNVHISLISAFIRHWRDALPQIDRIYREKVTDLELRHLAQNVHLAGAAWRGNGVEQAAKSGFDVAQKILGL